MTKKIICINNNTTIIDKYIEFLNNFDCNLYIAQNLYKGFSIAESIIPDIIIYSDNENIHDTQNFIDKIKKAPLLNDPILTIISPNKNTMDINADYWLTPDLDKYEFYELIGSMIKYKSIKDELHKTQKKYNSAMYYLKKYKNDLAKTNKHMIKEKNMLHNSLRQISLMIDERERNRQEIEKIDNFYNNNFDGLVKLLSMITESKRQYHTGHNKKVAEISVFFAKKLNLDKKQRRNIEIAALVHEIGKIEISDELTMKSPLDYNAFEKDLFLMHPVKGAKLLENIVGFEQIAKIVKHIHENFDGTGIPDKLSREKIPIGSRIIAALNIFDNLVLREGGLSVDEAFKIIEDKTSSKLDPAVVNCLHQYISINPVNKKERIYEKRIYELEPEMVLASGIFTSSGAKLLPINTVLTTKSINQIFKYNKIDPLLETVYIKGVI